MLYKALLLVVFLCLARSPRAQSVVYAPVAGNPLAAHLEVIGKAGNFYWVQKHKKSKGFKKRNAGETHEEGSFEIYNTRLNHVNTIPYTISNTTLKQYLIAGDTYLDQLLITSGSNKTQLSINRFSPEGNPVSTNVPLRHFPGSMNGNDFLLLRSQDKTKLLLLGFEPVDGATPRVHAILYNNNWGILSQTVFHDPNLTQPFIQYDLIHYPLEHFDNSPVKLTNNGDWLMVAPSRRSNDYVLFHFQDGAGNFIQADIKLPQNPRVQSVSLSLNTGTKDVFAGMVLHAGASSAKKVRVVRYLLSECRFVLDTTYQFQTLAGNKAGEEHLYEQYFMPVPGNGFLFLKEYGRPYRSRYFTEDVQTSSKQEVGNDAVTDAVPALFKKGDYTRHGSLSALRREWERGDLSLYYFPATRQDSCWSGIINKPQTSELNSSYLSYACMPLEDKVLFLYNDVSYNNFKRSSTTVLNQKGHPLDEGVVFWRPANVLDFQRSRQIGARELAVPYEKNKGLGFAVIRL
jgi:hypothetical protein